ncbi:MAG: DUF4907 domain-containing protein [Bacteroidales bacterium]|jgi:hypothetical protein|nr:DUF4907 domain-containing protein [Bacteroidales bacterium]NPV35308.1 DUF4907 domain-containing protein [Bacteroidales bacterium]
MKRPGIGMMIMLIVFLCLGCGRQGVSTPHNVQNMADSIMPKVFRIEGGWGYEISKNGRTIIHQPFIPAIEGKIPFVDSLQALATAKLVILKIRKNIIPPAINQYELDSLGIAYKKSALTN